MDTFGLSSCLVDLIVIFSILLILLCGVLETHATRRGSNTLTPHPCARQCLANVRMPMKTQPLFILVHNGLWFTILDDGWFMALPWLTMAYQGIPRIPPITCHHIGFSSLSGQQLVAGIALTDPLSAPEEHGQQQ